MATSQRSDTRRARGVPLAFKLALVIAGVVAAFMLGFGAILGGFIEDTLRLRVMRSAVDAARAAAQADFHAWTHTYGTVDHGLSAAQVQERLSAMTPFEARRWDEDQARRAAVEWNRARLQRFVGEGSDILAAELFTLTGGRRDKLVASSYAGEMSFSPVVGGEPRAIGTGQAALGRFTLAGRTWMAIRGSHPVSDPSGAAVGEFAVYFDAAAVDQAVASMRLTVSYATGLFVLLGAGISFLLGKGVTRPLKRLQDDMRIVASGDLMHTTRSTTSDEIGQLARTFDALTKNLAEAREAERASSASRREVAVAAEVAASLFPERLRQPAGCDVAAFHAGRDELTGVQYDVLPMADGRSGLLLAQASGSGAPAALVMATARSALRVVARGASDPGAVLREVNALLAPDLRRGLSVSAVLVATSPDGVSIAVASAGQPGLLHFHAEGERLSALHAEGIALGFDAGPVFDRSLKVLERPMAPGDRLLLATRATLELAGADGSPLGEKRLAALLKREASHPAEACAARLAEALERFRGGKLPEDVTFLVLGRHGGAA